jgi:hypothetical protein
METNLELRRCGWLEKIANMGENRVPMKLLAAFCHGKSRRRGESKATIRHGYVDTLRKLLVTRLLEWVHSQWMDRNDFVHDITEQGAKREEVQQLRDSIAAEFLDGMESLLPEFHHLFSESFETLWAKPISDRRQWLVEMAAARAISEIEPEPPPPLDVEPEPPPEAPNPRRVRQRRAPPALSGRRRKRS